MSDGPCVCVESESHVKHMHDHDHVTQRLTDAGVYADSQLGPQNNAVLLPSGPDKERSRQSYY